MAASVWSAISAFLNNILILIAGGTIGTGSDAVTVQGIVPWIASNATVAVFVLGIPLVSFAVGLLARLIHRTFR